MIASVSGNSNDIFILTKLLTPPAQEHVEEIQTDNSPGNLPHSTDRDGRDGRGAAKDDSAFRPLGWTDGVIPIDFRTAISLGQYFSNDDIDTDVSQLSTLDFMKQDIVRLKDKLERNDVIPLDQDALVGLYIEMREELQKFESSGYRISEGVGPGGKHYFFELYDSFIKIDLGTEYKPLTSLEVLEYTRRIREIESTFPGHDKRAGVRESISANELFA
ncbi:MAG: hypothetical protein LBT08_01645 [Synergistaceae bacterium]|jgi:hypothetical protein|nr:hypothetical protein [Synergistaceae bacterium]